MSLIVIGPASQPRDIRVTPLSILSPSRRVLLDVLLDVAAGFSRDGVDPGTSCILGKLASDLRLHLRAHEDLNLGPLPRQGIHDTPSASTNAA